MEKKAPERKVLLREDDIFYVYDKRINKCVCENCEGIVKYGLILKVTVSNGETINSFECNKCHMKYTPYANYVRLSNSGELQIYNKEEVAARDKKRADDARKQALREKKKAAAIKDKKSYIKKSYDKKYDGKKRDSSDKRKKDYNKSYKSNSYTASANTKKSYDKRYTGIVKRQRSYE